MKVIYIFSFLFSMLFFSCSTTSSNSDTCGDGVIDPGEECDGQEMGGSTCASEGYYTGEIACSDTCTLDLSGCEGTGRCGDGVLNSEYGEQCDGEMLDNATCETQGFHEGTLGCRPDCSYDVSQCIGSCGDGVISHEEECDGDDFGDMTSCTDLHPNFHSGTLVCDPVDCTISDAQCNFCGDEIINGDEECDGPNLGPETCDTVDPVYHAGEGELSCTAQCAFDFSACHYCGDGVVNGDESCDGNDLGFNPTCGEMGYVPGAPACNQDCVDVNYSACPYWVEVSAGHTHTCAVDSLGGAWCWGSGTLGRLGTGSTSNQLTPVAVTLPSPASSISAGKDHTCAVLQNGEVWCWGRNDFGQLGTGDTTSSLIPMQVQATSNDFTFVSAGTDHTCAVKGSGGVACWGRATNGRLGNCDDTDNVLTPTTVYRSCGSPPMFPAMPLMYAVEVHVGVDFSCAFTSQQLDTEVACWGSNTDGRLGTNRTQAELAQATSARWVKDENDQNIFASKLTVGENHACVLGVGSTTRLVRCWGRNGAGQIGDGTTTHRHYPVYPLTDTSVSDSYIDGSRISAGFNYTSAKADNGDTYGWGHNGDGQLGTANLTSVSHAVSAPLLQDAEEISAGQEHTCWLRQGKIYCVGYNADGRLGDGTNNSTYATPTLVIIP